MQMYEELQVLSPLVPTREFYFLRYCQQIEQGMWAIADVSIDYSRVNQFVPPSRSRRLPSGCLIHDMPNGYSKVINATLFFLLFFFFFLNSHFQLHMCLIFQWFWSFSLLAILDRSLGWNMWKLKRKRLFIELIENISIAGWHLGHSDGLLHYRGCVRDLHVWWFPVHRQGTLAEVM